MLLPQSSVQEKEEKKTHQSSAVRPQNASTAAEGCCGEEDDDDDEIVCLCCCCCCSADRHSARSLGSISTLRRFSGTGGAYGFSAARFSIVEEREEKNGPREEESECSKRPPFRTRSQKNSNQCLTLSRPRRRQRLGLTKKSLRQTLALRPSLSLLYLTTLTTLAQRQHGQGAPRLAVGKIRALEPVGKKALVHRADDGEWDGDVTFFFSTSSTKNLIKTFLFSLSHTQTKQGAAVIAAPQHQLTIAAGAAAVQGVRALAGAAKERKLKRKQQREEAEAEAGESDSQSSVSPSPASSRAPSRGASSSALALSSSSAAAAAEEASSVTQPVDLVWSDLSVFVPDKAAAAAAAAASDAAADAAAAKNKNKKRNKKLPKKAILFRVSGVAAAGRLVAIMGPSGGGKTTLLHALAGQLARAPGLEATGSVVALVPTTKKENGAGGAGETAAAASAKRTPARHPPRVAFVQQSDEFFSMLTVRETLELAARLRAKKDTPDAEITATAEALMRRLGLAKVADARVGGGRARGLSGGERKRLSIACELVGSPAVLFADEPTSGLDSFQAERVVAALSELAKAEGRTVVASVHQPRSSAFALFDDLVLLAEGRVAYSGPAADALAYFASKEGGAHSCPQHFNPAEFLADLVSVDHSSPEAEEASRARVKGITDAWAAKQERDARGKGGGGASELARSSSHHHHHHSHSHHGSRTSFLTQLSLLGRRAWRQTTRDRATALARAASSLSSALIFGSIYWRLGKGQASIQDRMGLLQVSAINAAMSALVKTLSAFPRVSKARAPFFFFF